MAVAVLCFNTSAHAQDGRNRDSWLTRARQQEKADQPTAPKAIPLDRPGFMPAESLPVPQDIVPTYILANGEVQTRNVDDDPGDLSQDEILRRIARIYGYQSQILMAEASGDQEQAGNLLDLALTELTTLAHHPGIMEQPRFRELYRSVITQYEKERGPIDSLSIQEGDIFQVRAEMFAEMDEVSSPLLEDVMEKRAPLPVRTAVPMTQNRLVESSLSFLERTSDKHILRWISRSETYFPMIEQIFREEGVPDELKYLAMIESALVPTAQSWAACVGLWQFSSATGRAYGLKIDRYVDERRDPEKSTRAAARLLKDLYEQFDHDWQLALAGYNCSPSRIQRAINRAERHLDRKATFWDIYNDIPRETRGYVPMYIATAMMASNPQAYGLGPVQPGPRYEYEVASIPGHMDLDRIADLADTDVATLKALNPELRRSSTPPVDGLYHLRMPVGSYQQFAANYHGDGSVRRAGATLVQYGRRTTRPIFVAENHQTQQRTEENGTPVVTVSDTAPSESTSRRSEPTEPSRVVYKVRRGDSLGKIADRYGVSVSNLKDWNDLHRNTIYPGERLSVYENGGPSESSDARETRVVYKVRRGDSLGKIASRYGVSVSDLKDWNDLSRNTIYVGQRLSVYTDGRSGKDTRIVYKVRRGDNLTEISRRYGVSISDIKGWNNLSRNTIRIGERLTIYPNGGGSSSGSKLIVHRVRRGDTLTELARRYGVSISQIKEWNDLRTSTIRVGQRLKIRT
ncbi:MAG TPA: LysM peptidoglycan-binding domain-containing protein [Rhodothermales bacterium]|nr:LysM peptidoglycan-binding domain-containing protein [Rhodothermales bacterium]